MKRYFFIILILFLLSESCNRNNNTKSDERIITVSISPFKCFIDSISGGDFSVNVMVPDGSDPHIYEPVPDQIKKLRFSEAYISNGFLGFEIVWLNRFYQMNQGMKKLNLGEYIDPIVPDHQHEDHLEGADPHYWMSPSCALRMSEAITGFLAELNPDSAAKYHENHIRLAMHIQQVGKKAEKLFGGNQSSSFMIYHPNLAYLARDYNLNEISVESEGKEPSPSDMKNLIDLAHSEGISTIFVQKEYDRRNAGAIASETGSKIVVIDPLSENWFESVNFIIDALHESFNQELWNGSLR